MLFRLRLHHHFFNLFWKREQKEELNPIDVRDLAQLNKLSITIIAFLWSDRRMKCLNGKELRETLGIGTTVFYKLKKAGMPAHQFPNSRPYYLLDEVSKWLHSQ